MCTGCTTHSIHMHPRMQDSSMHKGSHAVSTGVVYSVCIIIRRLMSCMHTIEHIRIGRDASQHSMARHSSSRWACTEHHVPCRGAADRGHGAGGCGEHLQRAQPDRVHAVLLLPCGHSGRQSCLVQEPRLQASPQQTPEFYTPDPYTFRP